MKLYATVQSERASKGQGGNDFIHIDITDDNKDLIAQLRFTPFVDTVGDGIKFRVWFDDRLIDVSTKLNHKGKFGIKCTHDYDNYGKCTECGQWRIDNKENIC